jgi:hypothetical protein
MNLRCLFEFCHVLYLLSSVDMFYFNKTADSVIGLAVSPESHPRCLGFLISFYLFGRANKGRKCNGRHLPCNLRSVCSTEHAKHRLVLPHAFAILYARHTADSVGITNLIDSLEYFSLAVWWKEMLLYFTFSPIFFSLKERTCGSLWVAHTYLAFTKVDNCFTVLEEPPAHQP